MPAPKGSKNALGNKGGGRTSIQSTFKHKINLDRISGQAWYIAEKIIDNENYKDQDFRKKLILKIVGQSVPRDLRIEGGVNPLRVISVGQYEAERINKEEG